MLKQTIQDAVNEQIKNEIYSAYLYVSMAAYFESLTLQGSAKWMKVQAHEEWTHAMKFYDWVFDRGGRVTLKAIDAPPATFQSPLDAWQQVLEHERKVTGLINQIYELALKENDYAAQTMLQWFINEQVEEEKNATEIVEKFKMIGSQSASLLMYDGHLSRRGE